jgi:hypothetical protein
MVTRTNIYRSEVAAAVHEMMAGGHRAGLIGDETMREFDASCLVPEPSLVTPDAAGTDPSMDDNVEDGSPQNPH